MSEASLSIVPVVVYTSTTLLLPFFARNHGIFFAVSSFIDLSDGKKNYQCFDAAELWKSLLFKSVSTTIVNVQTKNLGLK
jgi:hypothetical protein